MRFVEVVTYLAHERRSGRIERTVGEDGIYRHRLTGADGQTMSSGQHTSVS
jgi:hypothetical protein